MACVWHEFSRIYIHFSTKKFICILFLSTLFVVTFLSGNLSKYIIRHSEDTTPDFPPNPSCTCGYKNLNFDLCFGKGSTPFSCRLLGRLKNGNEIFIFEQFFKFFFFKFTQYFIFPRVIWTNLDIYPQEK